MAAPNIVNVSTITGKTDGAVITTTSSDMLLNAAASGKVIKVNTIMVANVDGTNSVDITVSFYNAANSTTYRLAYLVTIPAKASFDVLAKTIYLKEGDKIVATASANSRAELVISYEEIS